MTSGDEVIVLDNPLAYGKGEILYVEGNGWLRIRFDDGHEEHFDPHEVELISVWVEGHDILPGADLFAPAEGVLPQPDPGYGRPSCS